jgi:hypothetical protein
MCWADLISPALQIEAEKQKKGGSACHAGEEEERRECWRGEEGERYAAARAGRCTATTRGQGLGRWRGEEDES